MMSRIILTYDLAMASGQDAGNRSMRAASRKAWSEEDYNACVDKVDRLVRANWLADHPGAAVEDVPMDEAYWLLQQTQGMSCIRR